MRLQPGKEAEKLFLGTVTFGRLCFVSFAFVMPCNSSHLKAKLVPCPVLQDAA